MHVIDVRDNDRNGVIAMSRDLLCKNFNVNVSTLVASSFSFITSTRLANAIKKNQASLVVVDRLKDAIAAVSARKLLTKDLSNYKIIYSVSSFDHRPTGVPTEVCRGIDCWVFDCQATELEYTNNEFIEVHRAVIIPPTTAITIADAHKNEQQRDALHISVVGDLSDGERLHRTVRAVAACTRSKVELHVYGTGKPRTIMPIVNEARHLDGLSVVWHGSDYNIAAVAADTDICISAFAVADNVDIFFRSLAIPVVEPDKIAETIASPQALSVAAERSLNDYNTMYNPTFHVEQWHSLLRNLL